MLWMRVRKVTYDCFGVQERLGYTRRLCTRCYINVKEMKTHLAASRLRDFVVCSRSYSHGFSRIIDYQRRCDSDILSTTASMPSGSALRQAT